MDESFIAGGKTTSSNKSRIFKIVWTLLPHRFFFPKLDGSETVDSKSSLFWIHCPTYYNNVSCTTRSSSAEANSFHLQSQKNNFLSHIYFSFQRWLCQQVCAGRFWFLLLNVSIRLESLLPVTILEAGSNRLVCAVVKNVFNEGL